MAVTVFSMQLDFLPYAACEDESCDWAHPFSRDSRKLAKEHTARTGHDTSVTRENVTHFYVNEGDNVPVPAMQNG